MTTEPSEILTGHCPVCGAPVEWESITLFGKAMMQSLVPACDPCAAQQNAALEAERVAKAWAALLSSRMDPTYRAAVPARVKPCYASALAWQPDGGKPGGVGLIGISGHGKSCALACLVMSLKLPFLWWSGTEARDAHLESVTTDKDRVGARQRWNHGSTVPLLVLDDVSQGKMTESWSSALFGLLEARNAARLPTLWTCQIELTELRAKIDRQNDHDMAQAQAITRRLANETLILRA